MARLPFPLVAIADHQVLGPHLLPSAVAAVAAGMPWLCLRAKDLDTEARTILGRRLQRECPGAILSVHGDPAAARALGSHGLHLPSTGFDVGALRREFPRLLLGVSCHNRAELERCQRAGADYAFLSPLFSPRSKPAPDRCLGVDGFRHRVGGLQLPVLALGGVTVDRLPDAARAGAAGAAVLGSLFLAPDLSAAARAYAGGAAVFLRAATRGE